MVDSKNIVVAVDQAVHPIIYDVHQGEQGAREFKVQFSAGGVVLQLTQYDVVTVTITIDGTVVSNIKTNVALSHNFVRFILDKSATSKSGIAEMCLVITHQDSEYSNIKILNSAVVRLRIYPMSINNDVNKELLDKEDVTALNKQLETVLNGGA